mmetsp:Transcript_3291/g.5998  ORF Transcript_3291/g.5998 Transcript_3291/m.5998 type:complete len:208 (-) Transcript_3291:63-686(-)
MSPGTLPAGTTDWRVAPSGDWKATWSPGSTPFGTVTWNADCRPRRMLQGFPGTTSGGRGSNNGSPCGPITQTGLPAAASSGAVNVNVWHGAVCATTRPQGSFRFPACCCICVVSSCCVCGTGSTRDRGPTAFMVSTFGDFFVCGVGRVRGCRISLEDLLVAAEGRHCDTVSSALKMKELISLWIFAPHSSRVMDQHKPTGVLCPSAR